MPLKINGSVNIIQGPGFAKHLFSRKIFKKPLKSNSFKNFRMLSRFDKKGVLLKGF